MPLYSCKYCEFSTKSKYNFTRHLNTKKHRERLIMLKDKGGNIPEIKSHLVIDKPESVNLVNPPIIIINPTRKVINNNQNEI